MSRVCTLALLWPPCLFVFLLKVHHPPLESSESHAGAAALKVCQRGEAPGASLKSPIAWQSPKQMTGPVWSSGGAEPKRGQEPTAVHRHAVHKPHRSGFTGKPVCTPAHYLQLHTLFLLSFLLPPSYQNK